MKNKITSFFTSPIVYVLLAGFLLRLIFSAFGTLKLDQGTFISWSNILAAGGFKYFYNSWSDYLPGYLYALWLLGKINLLNVIPPTLLYKLPAIISDLVTGFLIYKILAKSKSEKWGLIGAAVYIFNPAILANSTFWGQVDSLTALTSLFAVYIFPSNLLLSAASLSVGTLIKPQTAFIFPVILFLFLKHKKKFTDLLIYCLAGLLIFAGAFYPFWNHGTLISFIFERLGVSFNQYPYTSVNAFNFWSLGGFWKPDYPYFDIAGYIVVLAASIFLCFKLWKKKGAEYYLLSFIFGAVFVFFTRMHERHLLPVIAPLTIVAIENPVFAIPLSVFSLTYTLNLYYAYVWITKNFKQVFPDIALKLFALLNIGSVIFIAYSLLNNLKTGWQKITVSANKFMEGGKVIKQTVALPKVDLPKGRMRYILYLILAFAFLARVFDLSSPPTMYFDEVYHAFTAKVILHGDPKAWEWWNTPPEGFAYEWTHPPLAKLGMVLGMLLFGENSFGWRIPGALLGVGSVYLVYLLAKELFKDELTGIMSAAAFSLDGLALVMSRIGMNDSYLLFFTLLSIYFFLKQKDALSAASFGLALASKWSAIWAIPILGILWLGRNNLPAGRHGKFTKSIIWFFILPPVIYMLSYFDMFLTGHGLDIWWGMQEQMWWYHTGLRATHPYSSPWWSWPFLIRPIYLYTSDEVGGMVARIYAFGNPFVFWFGFSSVIVSSFYAFLEKNKKLAIMVFSYFIFFVPWALSPRIMFLYHYLPSVPFMCIATGYVLRRNLKLAYVYFLAGLIIFIYFFPHWAGLQIPLWLDKSYYWLESWR